MDQTPRMAPITRLALVAAVTALFIAGCGVRDSYRSDIDRMKADLAEAKAAGAERFAPEEYALAEACLDWYTHYATQFDHVGDATMANLPARCRTAFASLKSKMLAVREGKMPLEAVSPPVAPRPEAAAPGAAAREMEKGKALPLEPVFFDYDRSVIRADAKKGLDQNVKWLKDNRDAKITIEGHCDERGTREYNLGLGQRRAKATKDYLVAAGIDPKRIKTISYGKERPFALGHDESAWRLNRRAHFVSQ